MYGTLSLLVLAAFAGDGPVSRPVGVVPRAPAVQSETYAVLEGKLRRAIQGQQYEEALAAAKAMAAHADFRTAHPGHQKWVHYLVGLLNLELGRPAQALPSLIIVTGMEGATQEEWLTRIGAHARADDMTGAAQALLTMIERFPRGLDDMNDVFVVQLALSDEVDPQAGFALRSTLFARNWDYEHASGVWMKLIDEHLAAGRVDDARGVLPRVAAPWARAQLLSLNRYAPLVDADAGAGLAGYYARDLERMRKAADAADADVGARSTYAAALVEAGRYQDALNLTDAVLAGPTPESGTEAARDWTWVMDARARALMAVGRADDAVAQMRAAADRREEGGVNVSQTINLGWLYLRLGRHAEALQTVSEVPEDQVSPFGRMQAVQVRACAAHASGDAATAETAYAYLAEHWKDAPTAAYDALACRGDEDGMAENLKAQLADPATADTAVGAMHAYLEPALPTAFDREMFERHARVIARPDVVAARDQVGRPLSLPVTGPQF